jgi:hypothetical protein
MNASVTMQVTHGYSLKTETQPRLGVRSGPVLVVHVDGHVNTAHIVKAYKQPSNCYRLLQGL